MRLDSVYVTYWSLNDPLCQSQTLPVVRGLARDGWKVGLVTFEQPPWALPPAEESSVRAELARQGIPWVGLRYHKRPRLLATARDVIAGALCCRRLAREGARLLHGRGTVPGAIIRLASRSLDVLLFNDADGPLSQEYVDAGLFKAGSLPHRLARGAEKRLLAVADAVAVLTEHRRQEVLDQARAPVTVIPCAVDTRQFFPRDGEGRRLREELGLEGRVFVYAGKSGGWYLVDEMMDFVRDAGTRLGGATLLVLTAESPDRYLAGARARSLKCVVRTVNHAEMSSYLSAGDVGLSFRREAPSQKAASPIKNGEYLACGLPVVSTEGAGDYADLIRRERVGVVVSGRETAGWGGALSELSSLLADPGLRERCREVAVREVDLEGVVLPRYREVYRALLGRPS